MGLNRQLANLPDAITTDTSNNVGIGGSPSGSYKLDVTGTGRFTNNVTSTNPTSNTINLTVDTGYNYKGYNGYWGFRTGTAFDFNLDTYNSNTQITALKITQAGAATFSSSVTASNGVLIGNGGATATTNYLPKFTGASTIGNSTMQDDGTNVSITGGFTANSFLRVFKNGSDSLGAGAFMALYNAAGTAAIFQQLNASNGLDWWTTFGKIMTLTSGGNVGIGTSSPVALLNIYGSTHLQLQNATTGSASSDGTRIQLSGSDLQIINRETADTIFYTTDTERMRITSTGDMFLTGRSTNTDYALYFLSNDTTSNIYSSNSGAISKPLLFYTAGTERMRITSGGVLQVGPNSIASGATALDAGSAYFYNNIYIGNTSGTAGYACRIDGYNNAIYLLWANALGTDQGGVALNYGSTSWSPVSSDIRTKKNFETTQGLAEVLQIEPIKYHLLSDENDAIKRLGFKAQNLQPLIPEMVYETGKKLEDGSNILTITPDYLLPVLVKAIQEQQATITSLQEQINQIVATK